MSCNPYAPGRRLNLRWRECLWEGVRRAAVPGLRERRRVRRERHRALQPPVHQRRVPHRRVEGGRVRLALVLLVRVLAAEAACLPGPAG